MFVGHYAVGFVLKKKSTDIPLWLLFVAVQLVDILAFLLILLGVEKIIYNPVDNPYLRTILEYVPYSHSLSVNILLSFCVFLVFWKYKNKRWGVVLSIAVLSHWFIDALVHVADMPIFHDSVKVGLGLWKFPWLAYFLELSVFILAGYYLFKNYIEIKRCIILMLILSLSFSAMFFAPEAESSSNLVSAMSLFLYVLFALLAYWCEGFIKFKEKL